MKKITVSNFVKAPIDKVWEYFTDPKHIQNWNAVSPDWHSTDVTNDLVEGGSFSYHMETLDGKDGFEFRAIYDQVVPVERILYTTGDGHSVEITFSEVDDDTTVTEVFDAETENTVDEQKAAWQTILDNFKKYTESH